MFDFVDGLINGVLRGYSFLNATSLTLMYSGDGRCLYNIQRSVCICFVLLHWLVWYGDVAETQDKDFPVGESMKSERGCHGRWLLQCISLLWGAPSQSACHHLTMAACVN